MTTTVEKPFDVSPNRFRQLPPTCEVGRKASAEQHRLPLNISDTMREILHELSQPLTAISSFGAVALRNLDNQAERSDELRNTLQQMINASNLAAGIITRFRDASLGNQPRTQMVEIDDIVQAAVELLSHPIQEKGVKIRYDVMPARVDVDPLQIQEVLINLIRNAIEAVPSHHGRVEISIAERCGQIVVSVEDNGPGIDRDLLFQPVKSAKQGGMGIGLAVSRSIIESHGGTIWCSPNSLRGASVHFALPMPELEF